MCGRLGWARADSAGAKTLLNFRPTRLTVISLDPARGSTIGAKTGVNMGWSIFLVATVTEIRHLLGQRAAQAVWALPVDATATVSDFVGMGVCAA